MVKLYNVVKKNNNLIGINTTPTGIGSTSTSLYITTISAVLNHSKQSFIQNREDHSFKTTNKEYLGTLNRYDVTVNTSSDHELRTNDRVTVDIAPNTLVNKTIEYDTVSRKQL